MSDRVSTPIVVVGSGALARALVSALDDRVQAVLARDARAARELGDRCGAEAWSFEDAPRGDAPLLWVLAVADGAYGEVANRLARFARANDAALLTSGALELDVLDALADAGVAVGRFHPLAPFPRQRDSQPPSFAHVAIAVSGGDPVRALASDLARSLGAEPCELEPGRAADYHRSAAWLSNGLVGLFARVEATSGLASPGLRRGWIELLRRTLDALADAPAEAALTGPVARGEAGVVAEHLKGLPEGRDRALFLALARAQLELVRDRLPSDRVASLEALLKDPDA